MIVMKCYHCGNDSFFKPEGLGFDTSSSDAYLVAKETTVRYVCMKCGHVMWFDFSPIKELTKLNEKLEKSINDVAKIEQEIKSFESSNEWVKVCEIRTEIEKLNNIINDENNSLKVINESKLKIESLSKEHKLILRDTSNLKYGLEKKMNNAISNKNYCQTAIDDFLLKNKA
jgi:hypothetical protein